MTVQRILALLVMLASIFSGNFLLLEDTVKADSPYNSPYFEFMPADSLHNSTDVKTFEVIQNKPSPETFEHQKPPPLSKNIELKVSSSTVISVEEMKATGLLHKPVLSKLDSQLYSAIENQVPLYSSEDVFVSQNIAVILDITGEVSELTSMIASIGGSVHMAEQSYLVVKIPLDFLEVISQREEVLYVSMPSIPEEASSGLASRIHNSQSWYTRNLLGSGVKIGIIDAGFDGLVNLMGTEVPSSISGMCFQSNFVSSSNLSYCDQGTQHGTAVLESVFDISPSATYYISNPSTEIEIIQVVEWMIENNVKIINMSMSFHPDGPGDGTSPISYDILNTVNYAVTNGITWVNSAGNRASGNHWFGQWSDDDSDGWHRFSDLHSLNCSYYVAGKVVNAYLRWDGTWGNEDSDFELVLFRKNGGGFDIVKESTDEQSGGIFHYPREHLTYIVTQSGDYCLGIAEWYSPNVPNWFQIFSWGATLEHSTSERSVQSPADSSNSGMLTVGATNWSSSSTIESFSSRGPTVDGRVKPDIVAVDGVYSQSMQGDFYGTSQSSPHMAGIAALVAERFPEYTPVQIVSYLKNNALPRGGIVPNNVWGYGLAYLPSMVPATPSSVSAQSVPGIGIDVEWSLPLGDGGEPIELYTVISSPENILATTTPFGETGKLSTDLDSSEEWLYDLTLDASGMLVGVGSVEKDSTYQALIVRYTSYGTLDKSFGVNGSSTVSFGPGISSGRSVVIDHQSRIVVAGYTDEFGDNSNREWAIARFTTDGVLDNSFGQNGLVLTDFYLGTDTAHELVLDPTGKIVVAGSAYKNEQEGMQGIVARYLENGILDASFGNGGYVSVGSIGNSFETFTTVLIDSFGRIIVGGQTDCCGSDDALLYRFMGDTGLLDASYGTAGGLIIDHEGADNDFYKGTIDSHGRIIMVGRYGNDFSVSRFDPNGFPDSTFGGSGLVVTDIGTFDYPSSVDVDGNDGVVVAGFTSNGGDEDIWVARFDSDGILDEKFSSGGIAIVDFSGEDDRAWSVLSLGSGKIVSGGRSHNGTDRDLALVKFNESGDLEHGRSLTFTGLTAAVSYKFTVQASNTIGLSSISSASNLATAVTVPGAPRNVVGVAGNQMATITWDEPISDGGSEVLFYSLISSDSVLATSSDTTITILELENGTPYLFGLIAHNVVGASIVSQSSNSVIPLGTVPGRPGALSVERGDRNAMVSWAKSSDAWAATNQYSVSSYTVTSSQGNHVATTTPFGMNGKIIKDFGLADFEDTSLSKDISYDIDIDGNGKIIVAGYARSNGSNNNATIARFHQNGVADNTFGNDGQAILDINSVTDYYRSTVVSSDGSIFAAGDYSFVVEGGSDVVPLVAKYTAEGQLDTSFANQGIYNVPVEIDGSILSMGSNDILETPEGKILILIQENQGHSWSVIRLNSDGSLDNSFGIGGISAVVTGAGGFSAALDGSGKVVIGGYKLNSFATVTLAAMFRLDDEGVMDTTFGSGGIFVVPESKFEFSDIRDVLIHSNGQITVAGITSEDPSLASADNFLVMRVNTDGSFDNNFGTNGYVVTDFTSLRDRPFSVREDDNGKLLVSGYVDNGSNYDMAVARYSSLGVLDTTFGNSGVSIVDFGNGHDKVYSTEVTNEGLLFAVGYASNGTNDDFAVIRINDSGNLDDGTQSLVTGLKNGSTYEFSVVATNQVGNSIASDQSSTIIPMGLPGSPTSISASSYSSNAVEVSWSAPVDDGGGIDYYTVEVLPGSILSPVSTTTAIITGLANGTPYTFKVTASNVVGTSTSSAASDTVIPSALPGYPTQMSATGGDSHVVVSWTVPYGNGSSIIYYTVTSSTGSIGTTTETSLTVPGLINGTSYEFSVSATNVLGTGPTSPETSAVIPMTVPGAITNVLATSTAPGTAIVSWTAPHTDGGSNIIYYNVTSNQGSYSATTTATTHTLTELTNGLSYNFTISAVNVVGQGSSSFSNNVVPVDVPYAPGNVTAVGGDGKATVTWSAPDNNGSTIVLYTVSVIPSGFTSTTTGTHIVFESLLNGTEYRFRVVAMNGVGDSNPSDVSNPVTPRPVNFSLITKGRTFSVEGQSATYEIASFATPSSTSTYSSLINWGDGSSTNGTIIVEGLDGEVLGTHQYVENGTYDVRVTVIVNGVDHVSDTGVIEVSNADPLVNLGEFLAITFDDLASMKATFFDQGTLDTHVSHLDWGDGTTSSGLIDTSDNKVGANHVYSDSGTYIVTLTVTDDDGGTGIATSSVVITSANSTVSIPSISVWVMTLSVLFVIVIAFRKLRKIPRID